LWGTQDPFLEQAVLRSESEFAVRVTSWADRFRDFNYYLHLAQEKAPELIVLGMGMPKQEQLAKAQRAQAAGTPLIVCGGAILDFLGGKVARAPKRMRRIGLEWLYRFALEPRRLFRRYLMGNPAFLLKLAAWRRDGAP
jgi:N-acetylglucosaminyldiphosphoundecaprenol N-acetyl-beta-D-mannosaminyltransferase